MMGWQLFGISDRRCARPFSAAGALLVLAILLSSQPAYASAGQSATAALTREQIRDFLLKAKIVKSKSIPKGVTRPVRLTLTDGTLTHDAAFSVVDEHRQVERFSSGRVELDFVDSYKYSLAAYKLAELVGLDGMMPVHVERTWDGQKGALAWWVDAQMDEGTRLKNKVEVPNAAKWNEQMYRMRVFSALVRDTDRNLTNVLVSPQWKVVMIDFSRAFRLQPELQHLADLNKIDRNLLAKLETMQRDTVKAATGDFLTKFELDAVMQRRDLFVAHFKKLITERGEDKVLY